LSRPLLEVRELVVSYRRRGVARRALFNVSLSIGAGEAYGLVGESGCGKSTLALAVLGQLPAAGRLESGVVKLADETLDSGRQKHPRTAAALVPQDPGSALNPGMRVGEQVAEVYRYQQALSWRDSYGRALELFRRLALQQPEELLRRYPHQLSGGQQQRIAIALALAAEPTLLILDEPTTGLDATVQAEIVDLIGELRSKMSGATLLISHNLGLVARLCDRVGVLYAGRLVEEGEARDLFRDPRHPYTAGLLRALPRLGANKRDSRLEPIKGSLPPLGALVKGCVYAERCPLVQDVCGKVDPPALPAGSGRFSRCHFEEAVPLMRRGQSPSPEAPAPPPSPAVLPLLEARQLEKAFGSVRGRVRAVDKVSLVVSQGEVLGLVGESGSGKTTLAKLLVGLLEPDAGEILLFGERTSGRLEKRTRASLRAIQMVFQNPDTTLNPSWTVGAILRRAIRRLDPGRVDRGAGAEALAAAVQLRPQQLRARPRELSGGQRQRGAIGRAFAGSPQLIVCDEPVSSLDVSVQAAILNLLVDIQQERQASYLFISHDLAVVRYVADRIAVMYLGAVVETGSADDVFRPPHHPYTEALLSSALVLGGEPKPAVRMRGSPASRGATEGCRFHPRCPRKLGSICETTPPPWQRGAEGHEICCHIPIDQLRIQQEVQAG